ncbi:hypothetical protein [Solibacillus sp. FSL K6-1523]|uniref:hypothetical protein n=1 Tax=Solibacillus sp. FSL K6-1523 TaxID=2921471 RepID=UPI0030FB221C
MNSLFWITLTISIIGFVVLVSMKKGMESKVASVKANLEDEENTSKAKSVIWWIWGTIVWGIVSIILVVWSF